MYIIQAADGTDHLALHVHCMTSQTIPDMKSDALLDPYTKSSTDLATGVLCEHAPAAKLPHHCTLMTQWCFWWLPWDAAAGPLPSFSAGRACGSLLLPFKDCLLAHSLAPVRTPFSLSSTWGSAPVCAVAAAAAAAAAASADTSEEAELWACGSQSALFLLVPSMPLLSGDLCSMAAAGPGV